jgi:transcriptional regulator with XRE-family HTH domain
MVGRTVARPRHRIVIMGKVLESEKRRMEIKLDVVLKREFKARDLTVSQVSKECRIPKTTLQDWTTGVKPSAKTLHYLYDLASFLELSLKGLLFNVTDTNQNAEIIMSTVFLDRGTHYRITIEKLDGIGNLTKLIKG